MNRTTIWADRTHLRKSTLVVALAVGLGFAGVASGQATTGAIFGNITGAAGQTIQISGPGVNRTVAVGTNGRYSVADLPLGTYMVTLKDRNGKILSDQKNVKISVGAGTEVDFYLANSSNAKNLGAVKVYANALPVIDVTSVESSTTITAEDLQQLPVGRSAEAIALLAPGTVKGSPGFGNLVSFGGSSVSENAYYVNGYNTSEPYRNLGGFQLPYGSISQQQTLTGGYGAKYGRSDGGVLSQVGKRGTNQWHFGGQIAWAPSSLNAGGKNVYFPYERVPGVVGGQAFKLADPSLVGTMYHYRQHNKNWETIYSAYVGGPLIKDKLYIFLAAESSKTHGENVQSIGTSRVDYYTDHSTKYYGKIDWNINENNVLETTLLSSQQSDGAGATYDYNYTTKKPGQFVTANDQAINDAKFLIAHYTSYITDNATLSVLWGRGEFKDPTIYGNKSTLPFIAAGFNQNPAYWPAGTSPGTGIINNQTNSSVLAPDAANHTQGLRADFNYQLGNHNLGVGIDNMFYAGHDQGIASSGPGYLWTYLQNVDGNPYVVRKRVLTFRTSMSLRQNAYYFQDIWQATDNLQFNLGIRNDRFTNYNNVGEAFVDEKNQWEPRLGFSWDVNGDSTLKIYGTAGRYYLALPDNAAERAANSSTYEYTYYTYTGIDSNGLPTGLTQYKGPLSPDGENGGIKDPKQVTSANLKPQYLDEYIVGFDKQLNKSWVYGAKATYRDTKAVIDDECSPGQIAAKMTKMGLNPSDYTNSLYGAAYCRLINPGQTNDLLIARNDGSGYTTVQMSQKDWGYLQKPIRTIASLDLYLEHPFDGTWYGRIDYTYTYAYGNTAGQVRPDFNQNDVSKTEDWDSWQLMQGQDGQLFNSRKHQLRIRGAYQVTPELLVSTTAIIQSGTPQECLGYFGPNATGDPTGYNAGGVGNYHWCAGQIVHPGSSGYYAGHTPWTKQINLALRYTPAFADKRLAVKLDIFNVLNEQKAVQTNPRFADGSHVVFNQFHMGEFFVPPRFVRLSVSYDY